MKQELIAQLHLSFERLVHAEENSGTEFWLARELQDLLEYARWENFSKVIDRDKTACEAAGHEVGDHFLEITKMVVIGSCADREISDVMLTRYACYLIAQNGDPSKDPVAFAQTYFAVQTRKQEVVKQRLAQTERLSASTSRTTRKYDCCWDDVASPRKNFRLKRI